MVGAHFRAVHAAHPAERFFHEGVAAFRLHRAAAELFRDLFRIPKAPRIVDDGLAGIFFKKIPCQQPYHVVAFHKAALVIDEEAPVEITVPGDAHIRAGLLHLLDERPPVLRQHGIRHTVRKRAVRLHVHLRKAEGQMGLQFFKNETRAAVARVCHDGERLHAADVGIAEDVADVIIHHIERRHRPPALRLREIPGVYPLFDLFQPRVVIMMPPDRP